MSCGSPGLVPLLTVCKRWGAVALHELYRNPLLTTAAQAEKFSKLFTHSSTSDRDVKANPRRQNPVSLGASLVHLVTLFSWKDASPVAVASQLIDLALGKILSPSSIGRLKSLLSPTVPLSLPFSQGKFLHSLALHNLPLVMDKDLIPVIVHCKNIQSIDLSLCSGLGDDSLFAISRHLKSLLCLFIAGLPKVSSTGLLEIARYHRKTLKIIGIPGISLRL
ncbi:MAG: hypothetical protein SGCHY_002004 [Lobulomycetales sp.]